MVAPETMRIDKWLWSARFFKTRSLAVEDLGRGRVQVNGVIAKPAREVRPGDRVELRQGGIARVVVVQQLSLQRGPAPVAQTLYQETPESIAVREALLAQRRLAPDPGTSLTAGRPTKRDRRDIDRAVGRAVPRAPGSAAAHGGGWGSRWSASLDDPG